jgi:hypothetical protein
MTLKNMAHWWPKVKEPGPKSTACIFDICENKMPGGETPPLHGQRAFCQVSSPANDL